MCTTAPSMAKVRYKMLCTSLFQGFARKCNSCNHPSVQMAARHEDVSHVINVLLLCIEGDGV